MASYLSKPTQYAPYQPQIDAELYGKLLMKKESDYQEGVQKIDKSLQYISSLPASNDIDRQYLQSKINAITSELNKNAGLDWGDQSVQKLTTSHINSISNDPTVRQIVSSSAFWKKQFTQEAEDSDRSKGANVANKWLLMEKNYGNWLRSNKPGQAPRSQPYINYSDLDGDAEKGIKDIPSDKINKATWGVKPLIKNGKPVIGADGQPVMVQDLSKQDLISQEIEYRDPSKVHDYLINFLKQGNYYEQAKVNAQYSMKDMSAENFIRKKYGDLHPELINTNNEEIQYFKEQLLKLGNISDPIVRNKREELLNEITKRENSNSDIEESIRNLQQDYQDYQDENKRAGLQTDLYIKDWVNSKVKDFSFRKEGKLELQGETGIQKLRAAEAANLAERKFKAEQDEREYQHSRDKLKDDIENRKQSLKEKGIDPTTGAGILYPPTDTKLSQNSYNIIRETVKKTDRKIEDMGNELLYTALYEVSPKDANDIFTRDRNNKIVRRENLSDQTKKMLDSALAGYKMTKGEGSYFIRSDKQISLNKSTLPILQEILELESLQTDKKTTIKELEDKVLKNTGIQQIVDELNNNPIEIDNSLFTSAIGKKSTKITGEDLKTYNTLPEDIKEQITILFSTMPSVNLKNFFAGSGDALSLSYALKPYGLSIDQAYMLFKTDDALGEGPLGLFGGPLRSTDPKIQRAAKLINTANDAFDSKFSKKLNEEFESKNLLYTPNIIPWGQGDESERKASKEYARLAAKTLGNKGDKFISAVEKGPDPAFYYTIDAGTGDYMLAVENKGSFEMIPIDRRTAESSNFNFSKLAPKDSYLSQRLLWNPDGGTIPKNQTASYKNALSLGLFRGSDNKERELRYHIVPKFNSYWMYTYSIDPSAKNEEDRIHFNMEEIPTKDINAVNLAIVKAEDKIKQLNDFIKRK